MSNAGGRIGQRRKSYPSVFIILLNWNGWRDTLECVQSLRRMTYPNYTIVVVDNGSAGDDVQILRGEASDCHVIANGRNDGFSEGNNIGMRYALAQGADYTLILNNDTVVDPECLSKLVTVAESDERVGILSPKVHLYEQPNNAVYPCLAYLWPPMLIFHLALTGFLNHLVVKEANGVREVNYVDGCCFLVKGMVLEKTGLYDPAYFLGGYETLELGNRALRLGYRLVAVLDAVIWAKIAASIGGSRGSAVAYSYWTPRNRVIFARKNLSVLHYLLFLLGLPLHLLAWLAAYGRGARSPRVIVNILRGLRDGFTYRAGERVSAVETGV